MIHVSQQDSAAKPTAPRRWRSFSLRTLFVLMTVCCLLLAVWSIYVSPYRSQARSLAVVNRLQGDVQFAPAEGPFWQRWLVVRMLGNDAFTRVTHVDLSSRNLTDENLAALAGLNHLEALNLDRTPITDKNTTALRGMPKLRNLSLRYTDIGDATLPHLAALPHLESLHLTGTEVTDASIAELAKLQPRELFIRWTKITDEGAEQLTAVLPKCEVNHHALTTAIGTSPKR